MKDYSTYVFDLDGTLIDTIGDLAAAVNHSLTLNGLEPRSEKEVLGFVGNGVQRLMELAIYDGREIEFDQTFFDKVFLEFKTYYKAHSMDLSRPYEGIPELINELRCRGKAMAVVTNKMQEAAEDIVRTFFGDIFGAVVGDNPSLRRKPAPDMVDEALRRMGRTKEDTVYIGDSDVDLATARNSGLPCISVLWGFRTRSFLESVGADCLVEKPSEILV